MDIDPEIIKDKKFEKIGDKVFLSKNKILTEDDKKEIPPLILQASNGSYLYATSDLATIYQRMKDFNPNYILYVVDNRQALHFEQVFRTCEKSGLTKDTISSFSL